jgi:hypothetical protein
MATEALVPDLGLEQVESQGGEVQETQTQPDPKQADREYSQWIKGLKEDGDAGKHYRRIKDDYGRLQAISRLDPKGIDGVRERYAAIDGIAYSEKKGLDAVTAMQSALAESQTALDAIAQGDVDSLSEDTQAGLARMAPAILNRLAESDADAYTAAVLPHFVEALKGSELASSFNGLVDALNEKPPAWLKPEQRAEWTNDRLSRVLEHAGTMGKWFQAQEQRVKELGKDGGQAKPKLDGQPGEKSEGSTTANPQFWKENVYPETNAHAEQAFDKELRPWAEKLAKAGFRLSDAKKTALASEFVRGVIAEAVKNGDYTNQMGRYNRQRSPDRASVVSLFRSEFNRHASRVLEGLIKRDYGQVLDKRTAAKPAAQPATKSAPVVPQKGVKLVSMKPQRSDIDFPRTPADWIYQNKWRLKNGDVVQFRP